MSPILSALFLPLVLGAAPTIRQPVMFDTPEADRILAALQVFPPDNPWNQDVSRWPVHPNSRNIIASIGADKPLRHNSDMGFILVPPGQKRVPVKIVAYPDESDQGPVSRARQRAHRRLAGQLPGQEGHARPTCSATGCGEGGDRHAIVVDPVRRHALRVLPDRNAPTPAGRPPRPRSST